MRGIGTSGSNLQRSWRGGALVAYFAVCIFTSAFLLFQIQPMIARYILPWFGGTSAVWSTVMLFFQLLLTGGYAYANWLVKAGRRREIIHLALLGISILLMIGLGLVWKSPITPDASWKPETGAFPIWEIFKLLTISVGLPYFLLASNSPLMQAWFARTFPDKTAYRLYALSNVGSLLALVSYPVLFEPWLGLSSQGWQWSLLYLLFAALAAWGAIRSLRAKRVAEIAASRRTRSSSSDSASGRRSRGLVGGSGHDCVHSAARDHQPYHPGSGRYPLPLGTSSDYLPAQLHRGFLRGALVFPPGLPVPVLRRVGSLRLGVVLCADDEHRRANRCIFVRPVRRLHALPRRALPSAAARRPPHALLPDGLGRGRTGRGPNQLRGALCFSPVPGR